MAENKGCFKLGSLEADPEARILARVTCWDLAVRQRGWGKQERAAEKSWAWFTSVEGRKLPDGSGIKCITISPTLRQEEGLFVISVNWSGGVFITYLRWFYFGQRQFSRKGVSGGLLAANPCNAWGMDARTREGHGKAWTLVMPSAKAVVSDWLGSKILVLSLTGCVIRHKFLNSLSVGFLIRTYFIDYCEDRKELIHIMCLI